MKIIIFTLPYIEAENEAVRITEMLESGCIDRVHIRKPEVSSDSMRRLICEIPKELHCRLSIHSNPDLLSEFPGIGWHFSESRPEEECDGLLSRSCHTPIEAAEWAGKCDYVTLSPVFDSISKPGYHSACFNPGEEFLSNQEGRIVALGGVTPKRFASLKERGYYGAAMLGYAWKKNLKHLIEEIKCYSS